MNILEIVNQLVTELERCDSILPKVIMFTLKKMTEKLLSS